MCPLQLSLNLGPLPLVNTVTPAFPVNLDLPLSTRPAIDDGLEAGMEAPYLADLHERPEYRVLAGQGNVTVTSAKVQAAERAKQLDAAQVGHVAYMMANPKQPYTKSSKEDKIKKRDQAAKAADQAAKEKAKPKSARDPMSSEELVELHERYNAELELRRPGTYKWGLLRKHITFVPKFNNFSSSDEEAEDVDEELLAMAAGPAVEDHQGVL